MMRLAPPYRDIISARRPQGCPEDPKRQRSHQLARMSVRWRRPSPKHRRYHCLMRCRSRVFPAKRRHGSVQCLRMPGPSSSTLIRKSCPQQHRHLGPPHTAPAFKSYYPLPAKSPSAQTRAVPVPSPRRPAQVTCAPRLATSTAVLHQAVGQALRLAPAVPLRNPETRQHHPCDILTSWQQRLCISFVYHPPAQPHRVSGLAQS